jgi:hypothetical protein
MAGGGALGGRATPPVTLLAGMIVTTTVNLASRERL